MIANPSPAWGRVPPRAAGGGILNCDVNPTRLVALATLPFQGRD